MTKSVEKRKMGKLERRNTLTAYTFLAPNFIGFVVFTLIPVIFSIVLAFMNWSGGSKITWAGLDNFRLIFKDFSFTKSNLGIALPLGKNAPAIILPVHSVLFGKLYRALVAIFLFEVRIQICHAVFLRQRIPDLI